MTHFATLRDYRFESDIDDVRGAKFYGRDGSPIAKIADIVFDHHSGDIRYLVLAYGPGRRVLVGIHLAVADKYSFQSELSLEDLDRLPAFDLRYFENESQWRAFEQLHQSAMSDRLPPERRRSNVISFNGRKARNQWRDFENRVRRDLRHLREACSTCQQHDRRIA